MYTAIAAVLTFLAIPLHEAGHALAMRRCGVEIAQAGIGLSVRPCLTLHLRRLGFPITLSPWLLGAYVKPSPEGEKQLAALPYKAQALCYGAGCIADILYGTVLLGSAVIILAFEGGGRVAPTGWIMLATGLVLSVLILKFPRAVSAYVLPLVGLLSMAVTALVLTRDAKSVSGPIGIGRLTITFSLPEALGVAGVIALSIGLFNLMPLFPLDGGRIVNMVVDRADSRMSKAFQTITGVAVTLLVVFVLTNDLIRL